MLVEKAMQLAVLAAAGAWLWEARGAEAATSAAVRLCGRQLSNIMSKICHAYNSPAWDEPLEEQPDSLVRKRRQVSNGIADECCIYGCNWEQLTSYCAISSTSEALHEMEAHMIADRSAEGESAAAAAAEGGAAQATAGGRGARGARAEYRLRGVARAAPVVGTVSPLLTWGRTVHTDTPPAARDRAAAYVAVYARPYPEPDHSSSDV